MREERIMATKEGDGEPTREGPLMADATPLIHLSRVGRLGLLRGLFGSVIVPREVYREVVVTGRALGRADALVMDEAVGDWIEVREPDEGQERRIEALLEGVPLGRGEAECIVMARDGDLPVVLDDVVAVKTARRLGVKTYWTTSIVLLAVARHLLTKEEGREIVEELVRSGLRIRPEVLLAILERLGE